MRESPWPLPYYLPRAACSPWGIYRALTGGLLAWVEIAPVSPGHPRPLPALPPAHAGPCRPMRQGRGGGCQGGLSGVPPGIARETPLRNPGPISDPSR